MPKRKTKKPETIDNIIESMTSAESEIESVVKEINSVDDINPVTVETENPATIEANKNDIINNKRSELIRLSEDGEIDQSVKY